MWASEHAIMQVQQPWHFFIAETDAGQPTADFVFSSAMDMQIKLANDGYAQPHHRSEGLDDPFKPPGLLSVGITHGDGS